MKNSIRLTCAIVLILCWTSSAVALSINGGSEVLDVGAVTFTESYFDSLHSYYPDSGFFSFNEGISAEANDYDSGYDNRVRSHARQTTDIALIDNTLSVESAGTAETIPNGSVDGHAESYFNMYFTVDTSLAYFTVEYHAYNHQNDGSLRFVLSNETLDETIFESDGSWLSLSGVLTEGMYRLRSRAYTRTMGITDFGFDFSATETAPIPEPATLLLFGTGLVGLAGIGRKKFKK